MRFVFGAAAIGIIAASYVVCPDHIRDTITETVTPSEQVLIDMQDGFDTLAAFMKGPQDMQPESPAV